MKTILSVWTASAFFVTAFAQEHPAFVVRPETAPASKGAKAFVLKRGGGEESVWIGSKILLDSSSIKKASVVDCLDRPPLLQLDLTDVGGKKWREMSQQLNGKRFAVFLNGEFYSAFHVQANSFSDQPLTVAHFDVGELTVGKLWKFVNSLNKEIEAQTLAANRELMTP